MSRVAFHTPKLSATAETVKVVKWLKQPGAAVAEGEPFVELETDKTVLEVEAPVDGILAAVHAQEGEDIEAGALLAEFEERNVVAAPKATQAVAEPARHSPVVAGAVPVEISPMRLAVARSVAASRREIPTFWVERWVGTERIHALRAKATTGGARRPSVSDYFVKAIGHALARSPAVRTRWCETPGAEPRTERLDGINVGLVVAVSGGMMIPVLTDCDQTSLEELGTARQAAVDAAHNGRLASNMSGEATVSLSNLGAAGIDRFEAIVQPGQTAIVAIGRETTGPQAAARGSAAARGVHVVVSVDHRVVDGVEAGRFVSLIADWIEGGGDDA